MKCLICHNQFNVKRNITSLFVEPIRYRCPACDRRYQTKLKELILPIERYLLHVFYHVTESCGFQIDAFDDKYEEFLIKHLSNFRKGSTLIVVESLTEELFGLLDLIEISHIYVYCLYVFEI